MKNNTKQPYGLGFYVSLVGTVIILLWIGCYKFTPTEANAIKDLIENHPMSFWIYDVLSVQNVSNLVGTIEILVAVLLIIGLKYKPIAQLAGIALIGIFLMTLSYLFTTPGTIRIVDGIPVTDFFILKDIMYLGFGITYLQIANNR